jgi:3-dehydroquinate synthetase
VLDRYGPIPSVNGIGAAALQGRLVKDKKTIQSQVHFVLPTKIGEVVVKSDVPPEAVMKAIEMALADCR